MKKTITIFCLLISGFISFSQQSYIDSLKVVLASTKDDSNKVITLNKLSLAYAWSIPDTGMQYASEALTLSKKLKWELGEAWANSVMGYCLNTLGNYPLALDYLFKALTYAEKVNSIIGKINAYDGLSLAYRDMGEYQQSLFYFWKALSFENLGVENSYMVGGLAAIYAKNNQTDSAIYFASKALRLQPNSSGILFVAGDSYYKLNYLDSANYYFNRGIEGAKVNRTEIDLVDLYHGKALVYKSRNQMDSAIIYARKAMLEPFGKYYPRGVLNAITTLSNLYESNHQPDSTLKYLRAAISLRDSLFNREKTMAIQNLAFKEQEKQKDLEASQLKYKNQIRLNALTGSVFTLLVIAFLLFRNNKQKQKSFNLLQDQKQQIDHQKSELEHTLSNLKSTQTQLIQSEKMASLGELTAGIAHEIQNPLNFVNNFSEVNGELIKELEEAASSERRDASNEADIIATIKGNEEKINYHGKRAENIVKSMLQHSQKSTGNKEPTNINALADEYFRMTYHSFQSKQKDSTEIKLITDFDSTLPLINVIPQDIGRVLLNLFNNAFWASAERGRLEPACPVGRIGIRNSENANFDPASPAGGLPSPISHLHFSPSVTLITKNFGDHIEIRIADNGPGIPTHIIDKIFQPFFTTKPAGQGTGLGLSLVYDIVKAHGGSIQVVSNQQESGAIEGATIEGTEFIIRLPKNIH